MSKKLNNKVAVITPIFTKAGYSQEHSDAMPEFFANSVALKRGGTVEEMAKGFLFLASDDSSYMTGGVDTAECTAAFHQRRIITALTMTAEERYNIFLETYPEAALRLPQYAVASYLGMTTQFLSRIRSNKPKKKSI